MGNTHNIFVLIHLFNINIVNTYFCARNNDIIVTKSSCTQERLNLRSTLLKSIMFLFVFDEVSKTTR